MKSVKTLVNDIYDLFRPNAKHKFTGDSIAQFAEGLAKRISSKLEEERGTPGLRLSNLGTPCERKLWYSINKPQWAEALAPAARIKFLFGDILEELLLWLAREAGHKVEREQEEVECAGVKGHIDAVVDGGLVDCKSASTYSFNKFHDHDLPNNDAFGYLTQLDSYLSSTPNLEVTDEASFLVIDKTLGHITLDTYPKTGTDYEGVVEAKRKMLAYPLPPARGFHDEADGKSGNRKLGINCSYCDFKYTCWPGLRQFAYAKKPVFLTVVSREPNVEEVK